MGRPLFAAWCVGALSACSGGLTALDKAGDDVVGCDETAQVQVWADLDGDGYGLADEGLACGAGPGQALVAGDCDDDDPLAHPEGIESCDDADNDCDGTPDDGLIQSDWYEDVDGDGFGDDGSSLSDCAAPPGFVDDDTDCDDALVDVHPGADELCNDGLDDDCDGLADDADVVDPSLVTIWYRDLDGDQYGDDAVYQAQCAQPQPGSVPTGGDCADLDATRNPGEDEICNGIDDDCDGSYDDADAGIDPALLTDYYTDADGDGLGDAATLQARCFGGLGLVFDGSDCDDANFAVRGPVDWLVDGDADGVGAGVAVATSCTSPGIGHAPASAGVDCADADPGRFPGNLELCGDGLDQDCDGLDAGCGPIGSYLVNTGPDWTLDPPVYSCLEACSLIFGGIPADYHCSTSNLFLDYGAYVSGYADAFYCTNPRPEAFQLEPVGNPGYNCGVFGCAYSAYVTDNCFTARNWCWPG